MAIALFLVTKPLRAQITKKQYIERYKNLALGIECEYGIPVCITLGVAMLESRYGNSCAAISRNNHFGTGDNGVLRSYRYVCESYEDFARTLKSERYKELYTLEKSDYRGWAHGLQRCGYATDSRYAEKLIKIIEQNLI